MIGNLRFKGTYYVEVKNDKVRVNGEVIQLKEIPFLRYSLPKYDIEEVEYIAHNQKAFNSAVTIVEFELNDTTIESMELLNDTFEELDREYVKFIYTDVTDDDIERGTLGSDRLQRLMEVSESEYIDTVVIKDKSTKLSRTDIIKFKEEIGNVVKNCHIAVCNSPFSFSEDACLTALRARELLSEYSERDECAIPSARHECMDCCKCMRHINIEQDCLFDPEKKEKKDKRVEKKADKKDTKEEKGKTNKSKGIPLLDW